MTKIFLPAAANTGKPVFLDTSDSFYWQNDDASAPSAFAQPLFTTSFSGGILSSNALAPSQAAPSGTGNVTTTAAPASAVSTSLTFTNTIITPNIIPLGKADAFRQCVLAAENFLSSVFHPINSVTVNVEFSYESFKAAGLNSYFLVNSFQRADIISFDTLKAALPSSDVLPALNPGGSSSTWYVPSAYGRMLGIDNTALPGGTFDSTVLLNTDWYNTTPGWQFNQDVIAGLIHELSESVMGRIDSLGRGQNLNGSSYSNAWTTMDLFRYTAAGIYDYSNGTDGNPVYFSSDGGKTESVYPLNNQFTKADPTKSNPVDAADWDPNYNAVFSGVPPASTLNMNSSEISVLQALGWSEQMPEDFMTSSGDWQDTTTWSLGCMPIADPEDAFIGGSPNVVNATVSSNVAVNSIGTQAGNTLEIKSGYALNALNGAQINSATVGSTLSGNAGAIYVDSNAQLRLGGAFFNSGVLTVGVFKPTDIVPGYLFLNGPNPVALSGGGYVHLGQALAGGGYSRASVNGPGLTNINDIIDGGGTITVSAFDNQAAGTIKASQSGGNFLDIYAPSVANEGEIDVFANARLALGNFGASTLNNSGSVNLGWDGANAGTGAQLEIDGTVTISGAGTLAVRGSGAAIVSNAFGASTFVNNSNLRVTASAQIGDHGLLDTLNRPLNADYLTFNNHGAVVASGAGVTLTLDTGASAIDDGGGVIDAENAATLIIESTVLTGQSYVPGIQAAPFGGTIEANGGIVLIAGAVTAGPATAAAQVQGQIWAIKGEIDIEAGGSVAVPITIFGGVVNQLPGGVISGAVNIGAGATLSLDANPGTPNLVNASGAGGVVMLTRSQVALSGGANTVNFVAGPGNVATLSLTKNKWDTVNGSGGAITLNGAQASVVGGANAIVFQASTDDSVSLYSTNNAWDQVTGSNGFVSLTNAQTNIVGGADTVYLDGSTSDVVSLFNTNNAWDSLYGSNATVNVTNSQASIVGGADTVYLDGSTSDVVSLYNTNSAWDTLYGSNATAYVTRSQASFVGGADTIYLDGSASDFVSLYNTNNAWDSVYGSNATVYVTNAQANIVGGADTIYLDGSASDFVSLYNTNNAWDSVYGSNATVYVTNAQANIVGGADTAYLDGSGGDVVSLYNTNNAWDSIYGSNASVNVTNAQTNVVGGADTVYLDGSKSDAVSLYNTGAAADKIHGANATINLTNAQANFFDGGETMYLGGADTLGFQAAFGLDTINGYTSVDTLVFSIADQGRLAFSQSGGNTLITLDPNDVLTLTNVPPSNLGAIKYA